MSFVLTKSGTSNAYWAVLPPDDIETSTDAIANQTGCANDVTLLPCLRDAPAEALLVDGITILTGPVVDEVTLIDEPLNLIASGQLLRKDTLLGKFVFKFLVDKHSSFFLLADICPF